MYLIKQDWGGVIVAYKLRVEARRTGSYRTGHKKSANAFTVTCMDPRYVSLGMVNLANKTGPNVRTAPAGFELQLAAADREIDQAQLALNLKRDERDALCAEAFEAATPLTPSEIVAAGRQGEAS
jgi:hypothetical protein